MTDLERAARGAILLWELNPRRQALSRALGIPASQVTDEMLERAGRSSLNLRNPPMQNIPRSKKP